MAAGTDPPTSDQSVSRAQEGGAGAARYNAPPEGTAGTSSGRASSTLVDGRRARGQRTRESILATAVNLASVEGLEGLTIGRLATELGISKSGLFAHFGSKEELQLATIEAAGAIFVAAVVMPAREAEPGLPRLRALLDHMATYLRSEVFPGGCFFDAARAEYDSRPPSPVRDAIAEQFKGWEQHLANRIRAAQREGHLDPEVDPEQLAFELDALGTAANVRYQFDRDETAFERARHAIDARLAQVTK